MKIFLCVLFFAAVATAQKDDTISAKYNNILSTIEKAESMYYKLPQKSKQLQMMNAHVSLRLSDHLKRNFEEIRNNALSKMCNNTKCFGSEAFKRGIAKVCLHTDSVVDKKMNLFDDFISCSETHLDKVVNKIEVVEKNLAVLQDSKANLQKEYADKENRNEIVYVLEYHKTLVDRAADFLVKSVNELSSLYNVLAKSLDECTKNGYPEVSKDFYEVVNVKNCMKNFLFKKLDTRN